MHHKGESSRSCLPEEDAAMMLSNTLMASQVSHLLAPVLVMYEQSNCWLGSDVVL